MSYFGRLDEIGAGIIGRAVTDTLYVSPSGGNTDGRTWDGAFTTIQAALDAAPTDTGKATLILIGPNPTWYDINTTGDPTWSGNYILKGTHRAWASIKNTHASATSILNFTGKASVESLAFGLTGSGNGIVLTGKGFRVNHCGFNAIGATGASSCIWVGDGATINGGKIQDIEVRGNQSYTTGLTLNNASINEMTHIHMHNCLTGIHILNADSDVNTFVDMDLGLCTIGIDIDAGNAQHFFGVNFHGCTTNIDDEVGDHIFEHITGDFPIYTSPANLAGITATAHVDANTWGADTEIIAAGAIDVPFRVVGIVTVPNVTQWHSVRFSDDSGSTFYDETLFYSTKFQGTEHPPGTGFIFNKGTRISCSVKAESGGSDTIQVWLKVQEI
ncbi:MAG: hypothetical protein KOO60_07420 [Gemmatimonadales bacterium]|nr:hypothetical protein [Gemmatimonadales bacterium]